MPSLKFSKWLRKNADPDPFRSDKGETERSFFRILEKEREDFGPFPFARFARLSPVTAPKKEALRRLCFMHFAGYSALEEDCAEKNDTARFEKYNIHCAFLFHSRSVLFGRNSPFSHREKISLYRHSFAEAEICSSACAARINSIGKGFFSRRALSFYLNNSPMASALRIFTSFAGLGNRHAAEIRECSAAWYSRKRFEEDYRHLSAAARAFIASFSEKSGE